MNKYPRTQFLRPLLLCSLLAISHGALAAQPTLNLDKARIDAVFSSQTSDTPGCALGLSREGQMLYGKGYGLAELGLGAPITTRTVFDIGSVSKQFTATAVLLLVQDGKLKLSDTVQQLLPELAPLWKTPITVEQLLHHTAGLPDYAVLMLLQGVPGENVTGDEEALQVIKAVPTLNFAPGSHFSYSNTGYFLAGQIVQRVSGKTLDELLQARVFKPLGMEATHVRTDHTQVVKQRATAYSPGANGFVIDMSNWNQAGDGAVQSHVEDLARWAAELSHPKVLSPALVEQLARVGRTDSGAPTAYAMGQLVDSYRGLPRLHHGGVWAGYRAILMRFPAQGLDIALTCNRGDVPMQQLAQKVVDVVLEPLLQPVAEAAAAPPGFKPELLQGKYVNADGTAVLHVVPGSTPGSLQLRLGNSAPLQVLSERSLRTPGGTQLDWSADMKQLTLRQAAGAVTNSWQRVQPEPIAPELLKTLAGNYRHAGLAASWTLRAEGPTGLVLQSKGSPEMPLQALDANTLIVPGALLHVQRNAAGQPLALEYRSDRVRGLMFKRQ